MRSLRHGRVACRTTMTGAVTFAAPAQPPQPSKSELRFARSALQTLAEREPSPSARPHSPPKEITIFASARRPIHVPLNNRGRTKGSGIYFVKSQELKRCLWDWG